MKSFARERHELERFSKVGEETMTARLRLTWQESLFSLCVTVITIAGTALVLVVGGLHVLQGRLTVGGLLVVIAYLRRGLRAAVGDRAHHGLAAAGASRAPAACGRCSRWRPKTLDVDDAIDASGIDGDIVFEDVSFAYDASRQILQDISFEANRGEMVALVGLTGAGKTTLVSLIPRFYDPTGGRVLIDGVDVRDYACGRCASGSPSCRRSPCSSAGRSRDNIRYGRLDATDEEVRSRGAAAHAHDFIARLPARLRDSRGRGRGEPVGRRAPAPEHRPRAAEGRADPHPRRADLVARRDLGGDRVPGACGKLRAGPHDPRDRAPPVDDPRRRPDPRARRGHG